MSIEKIQLITTIIMCPFLLIGALILISNMHEKSLTAKQKKLRDNAKVINSIIIISISLIMVMLSSIKTTAINRGATDNDLKSMPIVKLQQTIEVSPTESTLPKNLNDSLIIIYGFGCYRCHDIHDELTTQLEKDKLTKSVYWVCAKSEQGKAFLKDHPVNTVPTIIYVGTDTKTDKLIFTQKALFTETKNNVVTFNVDNYNRILELKQEYQTK